MTIEQVYLAIENFEFWTPLGFFPFWAILEIFGILGYFGAVLSHFGAPVGT